MSWWDVTRALNSTGLAHSGRVMNSKNRLNKTEKVHALFTGFLKADVLAETDSVEFLEVSDVFVCDQGLVGFRRTVPTFTRIAYYGST